MCEPTNRVLSVGHPGDCGRVIPVAGCRERVHHEDGGCVTPGSGLEGAVTLKTVDMWPQFQGLEGCYPGKCGRVTPASGSGRSVTLETVDM